MTKVDECIKNKDWRELAKLTVATIKAKKARERKFKTIRANRDKNIEVIHYQIDKGRKG